MKALATKKNTPTGAIIGGLVAAMGASICCVGPLVLLLIGVSGSWISVLSAFDPWRPYFIMVVIALLVWAGWQVHRPIQNCPANSVCATPKQRRRYQYFYWFSSTAALLLVTSPHWLVWFF